eukprot:9631681-Heterocapsa_arctica.AAC.1
MPEDQGSTTNVALHTHIKDGQIQTVIILITTAMEITQDTKSGNKHIIGWLKTTKITVSRSKKKLRLPGKGTI